MEIRLGAKAFVPKVAPRTRLRVRESGAELLIEGSYGIDFLTLLDHWPGTRPALRHGRYTVPREELLPVVEALDSDTLSSESVIEWETDVGAARETLLAKRVLRAEMSRALHPKDPTIGLDVIPTLRPYQQVGVEYILDTLADERGVVVGDEMGLGKSIVSLAALEKLGAYPNLLVCPSLAIYNWKAEILGGYGKPGWLKERTVHVVTSTKKPLKDADFTIASYDAVWRMSQQMMKQWASMILDESHYIRNPGTQRSLGVRMVAPMVQGRRVIELSGTPCVNKYPEIFPQLEAIGRAQELGGEKRFEALSVKGAEEVHEELRATCLVRRFKKEALPQLPPKDRFPHPVQVDLAEYKRVEDEMYEFLAAHEGEEDLDFEERGKANGYFMRLRKLAGVAKIPWIVEWANSFLLGGDYLVIFTHHVEVGEAVARALQPWGVATIKGGTSPKSRMEAIHTLRQGKNKVLVAATLASGVSLDMTMACTALMSELQWTPAALEQAEDRLARSGQTRPVEIYYPLAEDTVDARVWEIMWNKNLMVTALTNGVSSEFEVRKTLVDELRKDRRRR